MAARAAGHGKTSIHVVRLSGDGDEADSDHDQRHGAYSGEDGIGVGPNHLSGRELLAAVITHELTSGSSRMPCDPGVETRPTLPGPLTIDQAAADRRCCVA
jgi:hypothetical protein